MPIILIKSSSDTAPRIPVPGSPYIFRITADKKWIVITVKETGAEKVYSAATLLQYAHNREGFYPEPVSAMAREALETFGIWKGSGEAIAPEKLATETLATIAGIKVYQELTRLGRFFAWVGDRFIYRASLSDLESDIRKSKGSR